MTIYSDTLHWSGITPILTLLLILTLLPNLTFYIIARGFHGTFATGAACQQRTLTPLDTWSWTCKCSYVETNLSWTCLVSGLLRFEHPPVLLLLLRSEILITFYLCRVIVWYQSMHAYGYNYAKCKRTELMYLYCGANSRWKQEVILFAWHESNLLG